MEKVCPSFSTVCSLLRDDDSNCPCRIQQGSPHHWIIHKISFWLAPSFYLFNYLCTIHMNSRECVLPPLANLVLHNSYAYTDCGWYCTPILLHCYNTLVTPIAGSVTHYTHWITTYVTITIIACGFNEYYSFVALFCNGLLKSPNSCHLF